MASVVEAPLLGVQEVAKLLGVTKGRASQLADPEIQARARRPFPPPATRLACGPLWRAEDVQAWAAEREATSA